MISMSPSQTALSGVTRDPPFGCVDHGPGSEGCSQQIAAHQATFRKEHLGMSRTRDVVHGEQLEALLPKPAVEDPLDHRTVDERGR